MPEQSIYIEYVLKICGKFSAHITHRVLEFSVTTNCN